MLNHRKMAEDTIIRTLIILIVLYYVMRIGYLFKICFYFTCENRNGKITFYFRNMNEIIHYGRETRSIVFCPIRTK